VLQGIDGLPEEVMDMVYHVTFTTRYVLFAVRYALLALSVLLVCLLVRRLLCGAATQGVQDSGVGTPV
jgi:hypothetical protein